MAKKKTNPLQKAMTSFIGLNNKNEKLMRGGASNLYGSSYDRERELGKTFGDMSDLIDGSFNSMGASKPRNQSNLEYIARSVLDLDPNDPTSIRKIEQKFTGNDAALANYFLQGNAGFVNMCNEIEVVCTGIPQLEDAIDTIRDNILSAEEANEEVSMDIRFTRAPDETTNAKYVQALHSAIGHLKLPKKLKDIVTPATIRYGRYSVITMPYSDIYNKLITSGNFDKNRFLDGYRAVSESFSEDCDNTSILESLGASKDTIESIGQDLSSVLENAKNIRIYDEVGDDYVPYLEDFAPMMENAGLITMMSKHIQKANTRMTKDLTKNSRTKRQNATPDGVADIDGSEFNIAGCYVRMVDPRFMVKIKILDHVLGYYYFENYSNDKYRPLTSGEMITNKYRNPEASMVIDGMVDKILGNLKYKDLVERDEQFKSLVLNALMYQEARDTQLNIKFLPPEYVVDFSLNEDENGNGRSSLMRSLYFGRIYVSLLNFNAINIITKSTDTEMYYFNDPGDGSDNNTISETIDSMRMANIDISAMHSGYLMNNTAVTNKRYFTSKPIGGEKPFEIDVISGQQLDLQNEFMENLLKRTIGAMGMPSGMVDQANEASYAIMVSNDNIKHLRRVISYQTSFNDSITQLYKNILKFSGVESIEDDIIDSLTCTLKKPRVQQQNHSQDSISSSTQIATQMIDTFLKSSNIDLTEQDTMVREHLISKLSMELASGLPWHRCQSLLSEAQIEASLQIAHNKHQEESDIETE